MTARDNAELAQQRQTLFMGETLRGMLLSAWGWRTVGAVATIAGFVLIGIGGVLLAIPVAALSRAADAPSGRSRARRPARRCSSPVLNTAVRKAPHPGAFPRSRAHLAAPTRHRSTGRTVQWVAHPHATNGSGARPDGREVAVARVVKIVELMGVSEESFDDAVRQAVKEASKTIRNITGVELIKATAQVEGDEIFEYHVTVRLAFAIERGQSADDEEEEAEEEEEEELEEDEEE